MTAPSPDGALDALLDRLEGEGMRLRVWSVAITFFGDAVADRGGVIRLSAVQDITGRLRLEPGALRTAMSRLAQSGWLTRERRGRASYYALTAQKRAETEAASARIYAAAAPARPDAWTLAFSPDASAQDDLRALGFGALEGGGWLGPAGALDATAALPGVSAFAAPGHAAHLRRGLIGASWGAPDAAARFQTVLRLLAPFEAALAGGFDARTPAQWRDAAAARCLVIHLWRRAALRAPMPPADLAPDDWPAEAARAMAARLHALLSPGAEAWLDACDGGPDGALPPRAVAARARFGA
jgi:phenylacetic acid degradation operon negative regulatory protein